MISVEPLNARLGAIVGGKPRFPAGFHPQITTANMKKLSDRLRKRRNQYSLFLHAVVKWLEMHFLHSGSLHLGTKVLEKYLTILRTRGKREAIAYCKGARSAILQWLADSDISNNLKTPLRRYGGPSILKLLDREVTGPQGYPKIRLVLSALYASRELTLPPVANVDAITSPPTYRGLDELATYVGDFWEELNIHRDRRKKVPKCVYWKRHHLTTKSGPNGHALWNALTDLYSLPDSLFDSICEIGGKRLSTRMKLLRDLGENNFLHRFFTGAKSKRFRKISAIASQEGKTREVAILDYWSQAALKGLHQYLFSVLRRIPQDCTFSQGSFLEKLPSDRGEDKYHSIDLTSATDRFPIDLICRVLSERFGEAYVTQWRSIMVGYPFWTKEHGEIAYATGNPMGAYSSWNSFALTHHYVVYKCCRDLGLNWKTAQYVILGDDVVIRNDALAKRYMEVLTQLGVEFSVKKTHTSPFMYEFAKRIIHSGVELTPFPIAALWTTRKQKSLQLGVLDSEQSKGWCCAERIPSILADLYSSFGMPRRFVGKLEKLLFVTHHMMKATRGEESAHAAIKAVADSYYPDVYIRAKQAENVCKHIVLTLLERSFATLKKPGKALGDVATELVCRITGAVFEETPVLIQGRANFEIDPSTLISSVPVLNVYGQIEEKYLQMRRSVDTLGKLSEGDWKTTFKSLQLPESDRVFYLRNQDIRVQASFALAKVLLRLMELAEQDSYWFKYEMMNRWILNPVTG